MDHLHQHYKKLVNAITSIKIECSSIKPKNSLKNHYLKYLNTHNFDLIRKDFTVYVRLKYGERTLSFPMNCSDKKIKRKIFNLIEMDIEGLQVLDVRYHIDELINSIHTKVGEKLSNLSHKDVISIIHVLYSRMSQEESIRKYNEAKGKICSILMNDGEEITRDELLEMWNMCQIKQILRS
jgi:hypothetical protein